MARDVPIFTTGQLFLHSCLHFFGLHLSAETMAIRVSFSSETSGSLSFLGGILLAKRLPKRGATTRKLFFV